MELKELKCKSCGANLKLDMDNLGAYCQFCGKKLMIDMEQLSDVMKEKEKTKQVKEKEEQETKRKELEHKHVLDKDKSDMKTFLVIEGTIIGVILLVLVLYGLSEYYEYFFLGLGIAVGLIAAYYIIKLINKYDIIKKIKNKIEK